MGGWQYLPNIFDVFSPRMPEYRFSQRSTDGSLAEFFAFCVFSPPAPPRWGAGAFLRSIDSPLWLLSFTLFQLYYGRHRGMHYASATHLHHLRA